MFSIRKSLKSKILAGLLFISIIPLSVVGMLTYHWERQSIITNVQRHLQSVAILKKQAIEEWIHHLRHVLILQAADPEFHKNAIAVVNGSGDPGGVGASVHDTLLAEFQRVFSLGHFTQIFLLDEDSGEIIFSSAPKETGKSREKETFFVRGREDFYVSEIYLSLSMGAPTMVVSGPVRDQKGNLICVLAAHVNLKHLSDIMLERTGLSETTETFLVNKSNLLITNTVFAPDGAFKKWIFGEGAKWALEGKNGIDVFVDYRNLSVIGAYLWMGEQKLALIAKQDTSEAFAPIIENGKRIILIGVLFLLLIICLGFLFVRGITRPLKRLVTATQKVGAGNLKVEIEAISMDEIGLLTSAFNDMVKKRQQAQKELNRYRNHLELLVEQKTAELKESQTALIETEKKAAG